MERQAERLPAGLDYRPYEQICFTSRLSLSEESPCREQIGLCSGQLLDY